MIKAKYIRKGFFETNKHFERRVNDALNACVEIQSVVYNIKYIGIIHKEKDIVKEIPKVQGFCLTSNKE